MPQSAELPLSFRNLLEVGTDWMDLSRIDKGGTETGRNLFRDLLTSDQGIQTDAASHSLRSLRHFYFENRNHEKLVGAGKLALGFPLVLQRNQHNNWQLQPLFLIPLNMEPALQKPESWVLRRSTSKNWRLNPALISDNDPPFSGKPDLTGLEKYLEKFTKARNWYLPENITTEIHPFHLPGDENAPDVILYPGAVLGLFPGGYLPDGLIPPEATEESLHPYGVPELLPADHTVFQAFLDGVRPRIHSAFPRRSRLLVRRVLTNQLAAGRRVLVVSDRAARLDEVRTELELIGLGGLCAVIRNQDYDRHLLAQLLQAELSDESVPVPPNEYQVLMTRYQRLYERLAVQYRTVRQPRLKAWDWTETVGHFLNRQEIEGRELLERQLKVSTFRWNTEEFTEIRSHLEESATLFTRVGTLNHPLQAIDAGVFLENDLEGARAICTAGLSSWKKRLEELHFQILEEINTYAMQLTELFEAHYLELRQGVDLILNRLEDFRLRFGNRTWERATPGKIGALLSERKKEIRQQQEEIFRAARRLEQRSRDTEFTTFSLDLQLSRPSRLHAKMEAFREQLESWRFRIPELVDEEVQRFSSRHIHPSLSKKLGARQVEQQMDQLLKTIAETGWLAAPLDHRMLSLPQRQKHIEKITEVLDSVELNLRDFDHYYHWQRHWLSLTENSRAVIQALIKVKSENWKAAFDSWYLHQILRRQPVENIPDNGEALSDLLDSHEALQTVFPAVVRQQCLSRFRQAIREERRRNRRFVRQLGSTDRRAMPPLQDFFQNLPQSMATRFPIWCTTPDELGRLFQDEPWSFDAVIVWEANEVAPTLVEKLETVIPRSLVLSESKWRPGTSLHQALVGQPSPWDTLPLEEYEWEIEDIMGNYDSRLRINDAEAQAAIRRLNAITPTRQRTYPRIGIITMSKEQRNQIAAYLLEIKQSPGPATDKIQQLERNGMGVFTLEELAGQEFDHLLVCLEQDTAAPSGKAGQAARLTRLLRQRKLTLLHSLPDLSNDDSISAAGTLLLLTRSLTEKQYPAARGFVRQMRPQPTKTEYTHTFRDRLVDTLQAHSPDWRIETGKTGDLRLQLPSSGTEATWHLIPDLFRSRASFTSFEWEARQWKKDLAEGVTPLPIWSLEWWRNPTRAKRNFLKNLQATPTESAGIPLEEE